MYFKNPRLSENLTIFLWLFQGILVILQLTPEEWQLQIQAIKTKVQNRALEVG